LETDGVVCLLTPYNFVANRLRN